MTISMSLQRLSTAASSAPAVKDVGSGCYRVCVDDPTYTISILEEMFEWQRERIEIEIESERRLGKLLPNTHREIRTLVKLGAAILDEKRELGLLQPISERCPRTVLNAGAPAYMEVLANAESRQRVLEVVEMLVDDELVDDVNANPADYRGLLSEKKTTKPISCR